MDRKVLLITDKESDFSDLLKRSYGSVAEMSFAQALKCENISEFDSYCVLCGGTVPDARLRAKLEDEADAGKKMFLECPTAFGDVYSDMPVDNTRSRLIYIGGEYGTDIEGLSFGDLLDDESNQVCHPWVMPIYCTPILVYREHIIAHTHTDLPKDEILSGSYPGMWCYGNSESQRNVVMTSFILGNFNRARFAPRRAWQNLISWIIGFLTGEKTAEFPAPAVRYGFDTEPDFSDDSVFEKYRRESINNGMRFLSQFLVEDGEGGIQEGLRHNIHPDGNQDILTQIRTDCTGEAAGAYRMYSKFTGEKKYEDIADALTRFVFGPMVVRKGKSRGMMRWTETAWKICYQDDVARAVLPALYSVVFLGKNDLFAEAEPVLDYLVKTTAKDGCRQPRTDNNVGSEDRILALGNEPNGLVSAHYNAYYHAALLIAYRICGKEEYLDTARRGLETIMRMYPDNRREQSETQEICRMFLPLSLLYKITGKEEHLEMLHRVTDDLMKLRHPFGGYCEWDTGYTAVCSRNSNGECSLLTENGDPIADLLYSLNWLPLGFAFAYDATGDEKYMKLWREITVFFMKTQMKSENPLWDGGWCRAFDMTLEEAYANPHDIGWAAYNSETGWTVAEILMGMMIFDVMK